MLHGRDAERARLTAVLEDAHAGRATTLLIRGGAGVGKSALLEDTAAHARGVAVLRTVGLQSETAFAFAGLHRMLRPILDAAAALPAPQQQALRVAFGEGEGERLDPFLVALATLGLLTELSESGPVLCLVDDVQWLDAGSADALLFAARRLLAEPVAMLFAARDDDPAFVAPTDIPELTLEGLGHEAVRSLLTERTGHTVPDQVVADLATRTGGNPLAVVELPTQLNPAHLAGTAQLPDELPLSARVERVFLERCRRLPPTGQTLMLLAAADDSLPLSVLRAAGRELDVPDPTLTEVEATGLLRSDGDVVAVRHPLVRSAVYQAATMMERRTAHAALAGAVREIDPDRYAWHRAAAVDGPDEDVAADLEAVGARAERRRGYAAASTAYERAAQLTIRDDLRARRAFSAARNAYAAGGAQRAAALLKQARLIADDRLLRADIDRLRCRIEVVAGSAVDAHRIFLAAARDVADADPVRAVEMAAFAGVLHSHAVDSGATLPPGTLDTEVAADEPVRVQSLKLLLRTTDLDAAGDWGGALATLRAAREVGLASENRDVWANLGNMALHLGEDGLHRAFFTTMLSAARAEGAVMDVLYALNRLCLSQFAAGQWAAGRRSAEESSTLARSIGQPALTAIPTAWLTLLAAHQGSPEYDELLETATRTATNHRLGVMDQPVLDLLRWAQAARAAHEADHAEAVHHFDQMHVPALRSMAATARLAAASQAGERDRAAAWTSRLENFADATGSPWANAVAHYGRALLAGLGQHPDAADRVDPDDRAGHPHAATLFETALRHYEQTGRLYETASVQLSYGEHLRRSGHRVQARTHLKKALENFRDLHAEPLVDRATQELRASGETARKRDPSTMTQLTPTEAHIAQLVSQGLTNKEVAEQCWVSPRTVAFHLRNVFTKTGVTSRAQLAQLSLS